MDEEVIFASKSKRPYFFIYIFILTIIAVIILPFSMIIDKFSTFDYIASVLVILAGLFLSLVTFADLSDRIYITKTQIKMKHHQYNDRIPIFKGSSNINFEDVEKILLNPRKINVYFKDGKKTDIDFHFGDSKTCKTVFNELEKLVKDKCIRKYP